MISKNIIILKLVPRCQSGKPAMIYNPTSRSTSTLWNLNSYSPSSRKKYIWLQLIDQCSLSCSSMWLAWLARRRNHSIWKFIGMEWNAILISQLTIMRRWLPIWRRASLTRRKNCLRGDWNNFICMMIWANYGESTHQGLAWRENSKNRNRYWIVGSRSRCIYNKNPFTFFSVRMCYSIWEDTKSPLLK